MYVMQLYIGCTCVDLNHVCVRITVVFACTFVCLSSAYMYVYLCVCDQRMRLYVFNVIRMCASVCMYVRLCVCMCVSCTSI
jgi:hypothetical protein